MNPRKTILFSSLILTTIGILFLALSSSAESISTTGDPYHFLKKQLIWLVVCIPVFFLGKLISINFLFNRSFILYCLSVISLLLILIPSIGNQTLGARRWIDLGFFSVQPSEIAKMLSIIFFSAYFATGEVKLKNFILLIAIPIGLILAQPNLSTAVILAATIFSLYYISGGNTINIAVISLVGFFIGTLLIVLTPYRQARLQTLLNPESSSVNNYHSNQLILTLASGGISGKGFANSTQKYRFLPKISTDSIFAVIGEEIGFIGAIGILITYLLLITSIFKLGSLATDSFYGLMVIGIALFITFQTVINIAAVIAIIPLTGVPLPFISYGGSSLVTLFFAIGITQNLIYSNKDDNTKKSNHHRNSPHSRN